MTNHFKAAFMPVAFAISSVILGITVMKLESDKKQSDVSQHKTLPESCERTLRVVEACASDYIASAEKLGPDSYKDANQVVRQFADMRETFSKASAEVTDATCRVSSIKRENERLVDSMYWIVRQGTLHSPCEQAYKAFNPNAR